MDTSTFDKTRTVLDDEYPFYDKPEPVDPVKTKPEPTIALQNAGSGLDSDSIHSLVAVTAKVAGPNKLVATDSTGKLPASIIP